MHTTNRGEYVAIDQIHESTTNPRHTLRVVQARGAGRLHPAAWEAALGRAVRFSKPASVNNRRKLLCESATAVSAGRSRTRKSIAGWTYCRPTRRAAPELLAGEGERTRASLFSLGKAADCRPPGGSVRVMAFRMRRPLQRINSRSVRRPAPLVPPIESSERLSRYRWVESCSLSNSSRVK
jgi:hypothetical protein